MWREAPKHVVDEFKKLAQEKDQAVETKYPGSNGDPTLDGTLTSMGKATMTKPVGEHPAAELQLIEKRPEIKSSAPSYSGPGATGHDFRTHNLFSGVSSHQNIDPQLAGPANRGVSSSFPARSALNDGNSTQGQEYGEFDGSSGAQRENFQPAIDFDDELYSQYLNETALAEHPQVASDYPAVRQQ